MPEKCEKLSNLYIDESSSQIYERTKVVSKNMRRKCRPYGIQLHIRHREK
jgi:hypothetical protein